MKKQPKALIAAFADPSASPRPRRMVQYCRHKGFAVSLLTLPPSGQIDAQTTYPIASNMRYWLIRRKLAAVYIGILFYLIRSESYRQRIIEFAYGLAQKRQCFETEYDVIIVEDLYLLPFCLKYGDGTPIVFDAREFYTKQREDEFIFRLLERPARDWTCRKFLSSCHTVFTVSQGIAEAYYKEYGIRAEVLRSTPGRAKPCPPTKAPESGKVRLVHLGVANRNRRIENMIHVFEKLDSRFSFDLYLAGNRSYVRKLRNAVKGSDRIRICEPVKPDQIIPTLQEYDIGFYYLEPKGFNLKHSLPNKFFEFIQAGLAVAIGPSPEMMLLVKQFDCGFVAPAFSVESMAKTLNTIDSNSLKKARKGSLEAAEELCAEKEWGRLERTLEEFVD